MGPNDAPEAVAEAAGLHYVSDLDPGIRRRRAGKGWSYRLDDGPAVRDEETLTRIRILAIPPAWTDVWISPDSDGHIQATGRDAKGRKQYRYHARWRTVRDEDKFERLLHFGRALPALRDQVAHDLARRDLSRERVVATLVRLLETTLIRVGNAEYAKQNRSYGLTTMRDRHVSFSGDKLRFAFRGKSGVEHEVQIADRRLARIVRRCQDLPGQTLFQYLDEAGERHHVGSADVNEYLHAVMGADFTAKDFRTWAGTVLAAHALATCGPCETKTAAERQVVAAVDAVAAQLGNTRAVCRKCYIHPAVIVAYLEGVIPEFPDDLLIAGAALLGAERGLSPAETVVLAFLEAKLAADG